MPLVPTILLWTTAVSGVLLLTLIGLQRLLEPGPAPRRTELSATTVALTGNAVLAADEDRVAQAA